MIRLYIFGSVHKYLFPRQLNLSEIILLTIQFLSKILKFITIAINGSILYNIHIKLRDLTDWFGKEFYRISF